MLGNIATNFKLKLINMKTQVPFLMTTVMVTASLLFSSSCKKEMQNDEGTQPVQSQIENKRKTLSLTNISVDWNNWTNSVNYNVAMATADFGDINAFTQAEQSRTLISLSRLRVTLLKNVTNDAGGVITYSNIPDHSGYEINYKVKFHSAFDFKKAAVIGWGLGIGDGADGVADGEGGSFRIMYDKDANGNFYFKPVVYYADQPGSLGDDFGKRYPAVGSSLVGSVYYDVKMVFKANTKMNTNGRAELYINNVQVLNIPIRWTKDHTKRKANKLLFENYRTGTGSASTQDANIWYDDFTLANFNFTYPATWCDNLYTLANLYDPVSSTNYHLTTIDHSVNFDLKTAYAQTNQGETGTNFARRVDCCVAFNASMGQSYQPPGITIPTGHQVINGVSVQDSITRRYTLGIKSGNQLLAYPAYGTMAAILSDGANNAISAFTPLIENGQPVSQAILSTVGNYTRDTDPRQVIAQYANGDLLIFSCGGRGYGGVGMTADDVIRILSALNVEFAFMLDGGGSVTTVLNGERITPLIDGSGTEERARPNWLYIENQ